MCPCYSLRVGSALLAFAACLALSANALFGASASIFFTAALAGHVSPIVWVWSAVVVVGLWQSVAGLHAALGHSDQIRPVSLAWSVASIWLATYYLPQTVSEFTPESWAWLHAILIAWGAEHVANIWLQLRGLFRRMFRRRPIREFPVPFPVTPKRTRRVTVERIHLRT